MSLAWQVYIIEANPRASRTVPFVAKAIGHPIAKYASLIMSGKTLKELDFTEEPKLQHVAVKEAVLPFDKFPGAPPPTPLPLPGLLHFLLSGVLTVGQLLHFDSVVALQLGWCQCVTEGPYTWYVILCSWACPDTGMVVDSMVEVCNHMHTCMHTYIHTHGCLKEICIAGADTLLGPEMRSTGEVMGIDSDFSKAYAKAALSAGQKLPVSGNVFVSMTDKFKEAIVPIAKELKASS